MKTNGDNACCNASHEACTQGKILNSGARPERTSRLQVEGVDCPDEVAQIERALKPIAGVYSVYTNILSGKSTIEHDSSVEVEQLIEAINQTGLHAYEGKRAKPTGVMEQNRDRPWVLASGSLVFLGLLASWVVGVLLVEQILFSAAILCGGVVVFPNAWKALRQKRLDMNVLMTVAVFGAVGIGEWAEGAVVVFLFSLSELLESFSVGRARRAIQSLLDLTPPTAFLKKGDDFEEVSVEEVEPGSTVAVRSGDRIPLDGVVLHGNSSVDQAPITGESIPVSKGEGDAVFAGTINGEGSLEIRVTKPAEDTMLARIITMVEEAQASRAPSQRFVDVFAKYYTPSVVVLAGLVFLVPSVILGGAWDVWFYRALVLLVIACPCALVISTPVSIVSGLTAMARRGVLIKGGVFLEAIGGLRALAVDKTGTITEGKPRVIGIHAWRELEEKELIELAASIDAHSSHPLAQAIVAEANARSISFLRGTDFTSFHGRGAEAWIEGHRYFIGNHLFTHELGVCSEELEETLQGIESQGQTAIVLGHRPHDDCRGEVLGVFAIGDTLRENAAQAIQALHHAGVERVVMLSGDNQATVNAIARQAGIDEARGDLLPDNKIEVIKKLLREYRSVGMIGDGVNDAPAMAAATIGIAMGVAGTDTAIETADIALMKDDLGRVAETIKLGRRTLGIIRFNILFALGIKALFLILAILGWAGLWLAIAADVGATLLVIANAMRLLKIS